MKIARIKGTDPEQFVVITESDDPKALFHADILTEEQLREIMTSGGATKAQIDNLIIQARKHEVE